MNIQAKASVVVTKKGKYLLAVMMMMMIAKSNCLAWNGMWQWYCDVIHIMMTWVMDHLTEKTKTFSPKIHFQNHLPSEADYESNKFSQSSGLTRYASPHKHTKRLSRNYDHCYYLS